MQLKTGAGPASLGPSLMHVVSKSSCRAIRRLSLLFGPAAALLLLAGIALSPVCSAHAGEPATPAAKNGAAKDKGGGVTVQLPQSPPLDQPLLLCADALGHSPVCRNPG